MPTGCDTTYPDRVAAVPLLSTSSPADAAFYVVFGIFVVAFVVLAVIVIVWAVRHDVAGRQAWRARQEARLHGDHPPRESP